MAFQKILFRAPFSYDVMNLTLIYQTHFKDVQWQSGVNHIYEYENDCVSRQVICHCKEECVSFI